MAAKFEIRQREAGLFEWVLTSQGRVLAKSEVFSGKVACREAIESFRRAAPTAAVVDHTARPANAAEALAAGGRTTGRAVGKAAAIVAEVPSLAVEAARKVIGR